MLTHEEIELTRLPTSKTAELRHHITLDNDDEIVDADLREREEEVRSQNSTYDYNDHKFEAYLVVLGSFLGLITNLGLINSIGAIQAYVSEHQLANMKTSSVSWIFSIYLSLAYSVGIVTGGVFDKHGAFRILCLASFFLIGGMLGVAFSNEVYQFILSFIVLGISNGMSSTPCIAVLTHWFPQNKLAWIQGLATSAGSVGGLSFPLLLRYLYPKYGFKKAIIILACTLFGCSLIATFLVKERIKRQPKERLHPLSSETLEKQGKWRKVKRDLTIFSFSHLKDFKYDLLISGAFFGELSLVLVVTYFATYAIAQGNGESTGYLLLTVWNATGICGRCVPGYAADRFGKFNVNIIMLLGYSILIFVLWLPFGHNLKALFAFAAWGGFFLGLILSLMPSCLGEISRVLEYGERYGIVNFFLSFGNLIGIPIAAAIIGNGSILNYNHFVILVAVLSAVSILFWISTRCLVVGPRLNVKI